MTTIWSRDAVASIAHQPFATVPSSFTPDLAPVLPGFDLWDYWPVQECDGSVADIAGGALQMLLSAPVLPDPESRHALARIRAMHETADGWRDLGDLLPDGLAPGSREWSGSAIVSPDHDRVTLYFTAAGHRGEVEPSFDQRLFETSADLTIKDGVPHLSGWTTPIESVVADGVTYARDMTGGGGIGTIKAFRDPAWFRDPADGAEYLLFVGSAGWLDAIFDGVIGAARRKGDRWVLTPPLIEAVGTNSEMERPHIVVADGRYYLFWSTQAKRFSPAATEGVTGLYAMVADRIAGPWRPVNGTGLVAANPADEPFQAYCWWVTGEGDVISFVDFPGLEGRSPDTPETRRAHFGGTAAPWFRLTIDGDQVAISPDPSIS